MRKVLVAWIGKTDLRAPTESEQVGVGPIAQALEARAFDEAFLLSDYDEQGRCRLREVAARPRPRRASRSCRRSSVDPPSSARSTKPPCAAVQRALGDRARDTALTFHLSPGTPAMAAVWILLGKTRFPAELIESSKEHGVRTASVPFDISADFIPDLLREQDERLRQGSAGEPPRGSGVRRHHPSQPRDDPPHPARAAGRDPQRARAHRGRVGHRQGDARARASTARARGETGPSSPSTAAPSPPSSSRPSSSATRRARSPARSSRRKGYFEAADGGTLFLDELGELPGAGAGEAAARDSRRGGRAPRSEQAAEGRRPHRRRHQPHADRGDRRRALPRGPLLPPRRRRPEDPAAPRAHRRPRPAHRPPARAGEPRGRRRARLQGEETFCRRKESSPRAPLAGQRAGAAQHAAPRRHLERRCRHLLGRCARSAAPGRGSSPAGGARTAARGPASTSRTC